MRISVLLKRSQSTIRHTYMLISILALMALFVLAACREPDGMTFEYGQTRPQTTITPGIETIPQDQRLFVELAYSLSWDQPRCYGGAGEIPPSVYEVRQDGVWFAQAHGLPEHTIGLVATDFQYIDLGGQAITPITEVPFLIVGSHLDTVKVLRVNEDGSIIVEGFDGQFLLQAGETVSFEGIELLEQPSCRGQKHYQMKNHGWLAADMFHLMRGQFLGDP